MDIEKVIEENKKRNARYFRPYDPIAGDKEQEVIPRIRVYIDGEAYWLPKDMEDNPVIRKLRRGSAGGRSVGDILQTEGLDDNEANRQGLIDGLMQERLKYDTEFWMATCCYITDKLTKRLITLTLNTGQRELVAEYERQRRNHEPIRLILVKARQWGGSTATEAYMLWLQTFYFESWHSAIIAQDKAASANIRGMVTTAINNLPPFHPSLTLGNFENQPSIKFIKERNCKLFISSAERTEATRSFDFSMIHMSEICVWPATKKKSGDDIAQAIYATVPDYEGTMIVMESTAKGIMNFFHKQWLEAVENHRNGIKGLYPMFVGWYKIKMYTKRVHNMKEFISTLNDYEQWLWEQGATLEGINWYGWYKASKHYSDFQMKSEFPTTANEAFQTKAGRYFTEDLLLKLKSELCAPVFTGDLVGDTPKGASALNHLRLTGRNGTSEILKIWIRPEDSIDIRKETALNRFIVTVDVGGKTLRADNSVISVFDCLSIVEPHGAMERAALWFGHIDPDLLAWKAVQIAEWYGHALLVIESNTYDARYKKSDKVEYDGNHVFTVLDEVKEVYDNLYMRHKTPDTDSKYEETSKIGWHMNTKTKYQAYDRYCQNIRDDYYIEHSEDAYVEAELLELKNDGTIGAVEGYRDDIQDTTATANCIAFSEMDPVRIIPKVKVGKPKKRIGGMATI